MDEYPLKPETPDERAHEPRPRPVLGYRSPFDRVYKNTFAAAPAVIGFFAAIGVCAGAFVLFAATYEESRPVRLACFFGTAALFVLLALVRFPLQQRFGFSGFGRGLLVGTILGMFALAPCAGLYAFMLLWT